MVVQNNCYKVVTIGYLKSFIGENIQNSSGAVVYVNTNVLAPEKRRDDYCPTYSELIGGNLIPNWSGATTPKYDRDGITVSSSAHCGGNYANNQLVDRHDLGLKYTRLNSFSIARTDSGNISECGGSKSMTYTYKHVRTTKSMNSSSCSVSTSSETINSPCSGITYSSSNFGSVSACTTFSVGKNGSVSASSRTTTVTGSVTFRGSSSSSTVSFTQNALSGSYVSTSTTYAVTASAISPTDKKLNGCEAGQEYKANATGYKYDKYVWKDSCNATYASVTSATTATTTLATQSGATTALTCSPDSAVTKDYTLTFTYEGKSDSIIFTQTCPKCESPTCDCSGLTVTGKTDIAAAGGTSITIGSFTKASCISGSASVSSSTSWLSSVTVSGNDIKATVAANTGTSVREGTVTISADKDGGTCSKDMTIKQKGSSVTCSIEGDSTVENSCGGGEIQYNITQS